MRKFFYRGMALLLGFSCLTGISAQAAYSSPDDVTLSLRAMNGGYIPEDNVHKIYVSPEDAQNGTTLHFGLFFETDPAIVDIFNVEIMLSSETAKFKKDSYKNPTNYAYTTAQEFTHTDGNVYSSKFEPYCFGRINMMNTYETGASFCMYTMRENTFQLSWAYDYNGKDENGNTDFSARFFGNASDDYHFVEFDMTIDPETPAGVYPVEFVTDEEMKSGSTYIASDDSVPNEEDPKYYTSIYEKMIPRLNNVEIVVAEENPKTEIAPVFRYAHDETPFLIEDFPEDTEISYGGDVFRLRTENLVDIFEAGSPADIDMDEPVKILRSDLNLAGVRMQDAAGNPAALEYYVGKKGDVNLDGDVNASDAALVLTYAAGVGAGTSVSLTEDTDSTEEKFAFFLGDIDGEGAEDSVLNAEDASKILAYAARKGSGQNADWNTLS